MKIYRVYNHTTKNTNKGNVSQQNKKIKLGGQIGDKVFEDNVVRRATENLKNLRVSKPRFPKKYISLE